MRKVKLKQVGLEPLKPGTFEDIRALLEHNHELAQTLEALCFPIASIGDSPLSYVSSPVAPCTVVDAIAGVCSSVIHFIEPPFLRNIIDNYGR